MSKPGKDAPRVERLPPHSLEAEQAVLGCVLLDPMTVLPIVITELESAEVFYDLRHRTIYQQFIALFDQGCPIDMVTVCQGLKSGERLEAVGGMAYIMGLPETAPASSSVKSYLDIMREKYVRRKLIGVCTESAAYSYEENNSVEDLVAKTESDILRIGTGQNLGRNFQSARSLTDPSMEKIESMQKGGVVTGLATGFPDYDAMTGGLQNGSLVVLAARTSMGKSSFMMNVADHLAIELKVPVGIFSLEMTAQELMIRAIASRARVNLKTINASDPRDVTKVGVAANQLRKSPLWIDDEHGLSLQKLRAKARRLVGETGAKVFMVDYLQLLTNPEMRNESRATIVGSFSGGLKAMAKELNVTVIALAQLNRDMDKDKPRAPRLSDLRESGAIEQDADLVALMHKGVEDDDSIAVRVAVDIAKQRSGPTGRFHLVFLKQFTRFESIAKDTVMETPEMGI